MALNPSESVNVSLSVTSLPGTLPGIYSFNISTQDANHPEHFLLAEASYIVLAPPPDTTSPVITPLVTGIPGQNGWYVVPGPVTVSFTVEDNESAITSQTGCDTATVSVETAGDTFTCTATSTGGTSTEA